MYDGEKIKSLESLKDEIDCLKRQGKKIVQCHGCFDVLHIGHIKHLQSAKKEGDVLVITVTPDRFIQKGPGRPFFNENLRLEQIAALGCVDYVALNKWETAVESLKILQPDVYAKGKEVLDNATVDVSDNGNGKKSNLNLEKEIINSIGGRLVLTDEDTFSSSRIINEISASIPDETRKYLNEFKLKYSSNRLNGILDSLKGSRVLVIGDAILDEYIFCKDMEKSAKEALVAYSHLSSEMHAGGVFAVANHVAEFSDNVTLLTALGNNHENFVENKLNKKIKRHILRRDDLETLVKRRYINQYKNIKVFEFYNVADFEVDKEIENELIDHIVKENDFDMILATDFGHGLMTPKIINTLTSSSKFLAVNTQLNSGNAGYNFITKYSRADFVSLNDRELRMPMQDKTGDIKYPIKKLADILNLKGLNITLGKAGDIYYQDAKYYSAPVLTKHSIDTIGAGDAVLAIGSLLAHNNIEPELMPFYANTVGALAVKIMGNREPVKPTELKRFISYILK